MVFFGGKNALFCVIFLYLISCSWWLPGKDLEFKKFENLSMQDGLSHSTVSCIVQDRYGFLWFATQDGLNRYDGYEYKTFYHDPGNPNSLSNNGLICLMEDHAGNIWVGTSAGGLNKFDPVTETFTCYKSDPGNPKRLQSDYIRALHEDEAGNIWVGAETYLHRMDPKTGIFQSYRYHVPQSDTVNRREIRAILSDGSGTILVGGAHIGMALFDTKTETFEYFFKNQNSQGGLTSDNIKFFFPGVGNSFWVGTIGSGLLNFDRTTKQFSSAFSKYGDSSRSGISYLYAGFKSTSRPEILWITTSNGLVEFDTRENCVIDHLLAGQGNNLETNDLLGLLEDHEGNLWVGAYGKGLNKYVRKKSTFKEWLKFKGAENNSNNNIVFSAFEDSEGNVWIGTMGGGIERYDKASGNFTVYHFEPRDSNSVWSDFIRCMFLDKAGNLWAGTHGSGLNLLDPRTGKFTRFLHEEGNQESLSGNIINCLYEDRNGIFWIGTWGSGLNSMDREKRTFKRYFRANGQPSEINIQSIKTVKEDRWGNLWIGTWDDGLICLDRERKASRHFKHDDNNPYSINCNTIIYIYESDDGNLWFGTVGGGLNRFDRATERFEFLTTKDGLPNNIVYGILEDSEHHLWLSTNKGLARFDPESKGVEVFNMADGLPSNEFNTAACFKSPSGEMYFGSTNGLVSFFPESLQRSTFVPPVIFTSFKLLNRDIELKRSISQLKELKLSYSDTFLIEFAALSYASPAKNQYAYKLSGLQDEWVPLGPKRTLNFAHLEPGYYDLTVKGSNSDGVWNETGASIRLIITPPFWRTWWFKLLVLLSLTCIAYYWHTVKLKNATLKLKTESAMNRLYARFKISEREQEIINLILKGKTNKDIEDTLFISIKTVKSHIYNIYRKMGVKNRLELINLIQKTLKE